eukprot:CAMPEP_0173123524 /NCGR_PEP_ID=MMETSP1102-20130122/55038_1 /TAXON_ID=49646 /ORGANISM="Geminigera sp., Strain Caron Lab Isolate" /LENGTH=107 /DNA_ID=CAMNT_0014031549 /DNA_START=79 /DNA_END=399 /DNA_ORIENTATION=+
MSRTLRGVRLAGDEKPMTAPANTTPRHIPKERSSSSLSHTVGTKGEFATRALASLPNPKLTWMMQPRTKTRPSSLHNTSNLDISDIDGAQPRKMFRLKSIHSPSSLP